MIGREREAGNKLNFIAFNFLQCIYTLPPGKQLFLSIQGEHNYTCRISLLYSFAQQGQNLYYISTGKYMSCCTAINQCNINTRSRGIKVNLKTWKKTSKYSKGIMEWDILGIRKLIKDTLFPEEGQSLSLWVNLFRHKFMFIQHRH